MSIIADLVLFKLTLSLIFLNFKNIQDFYFITYIFMCFRDKTEKLESLKLNILKEIEASDQEDKCLIEYRKELELLLQEKMAHVEELRQIHADINAVCL